MHQKPLNIARDLFGRGIINGAALIAGNTLIDYLAKLAERSGTAVSLSENKFIETIAGEKLNEVLFDSGVYDNSRYDQIKAWLSIRDEAAKNHENYTISEVEQMLKNIDQFVSEFGLE
jgi:hypothetical protein